MKKSKTRREFRVGPLNEDDGREFLTARVEKIGRRWQWAVGTNGCMNIGYGDGGNCGPELAAYRALERAERLVKMAGKLRDDLAEHYRSAKEGGE